MTSEGLLDERASKSRWRRNCETDTSRKTVFKRLYHLITTTAVPVDDDQRHPQRVDGTEMFCDVYLKFGERKANDLGNNGITCQINYRKLMSAFNTRPIRLPDD